MTRNTQEIRALLAELTAGSLRVFLLLLMASLTVFGQDSVNVYFSYYPGPNDTRPIERAYLPGSFNNWGNNTSGRIPNDDPSRMDWVDSLASYVYQIRLEVDESVQYKVHLQRNASGSDWSWLSDPLNPETIGPDFNSRLDVPALGVFQPVRLPVGTDKVNEVRAWILHSDSVTALTTEINGTAYSALDSLDQDTGLFRFRLLETVPTGSRFSVQVEDGAGRTAQSAIGIIIPEIEYAPVPAGIRDGITYDSVDPDRATLVLRAPGKGVVHLVTEETGWQAHPDFVLKKDTTDVLGDRFWIELDGLTSGDEIPFQYLVDGDIQIADPYAEKLLTPEDSDISNATYPDLLPFPDNHTRFSVSLLEPGRSPYPWQDSDYERPPQHELVIYELLLRDFVGTHDFATLVDTLEYLNRLGVNAIELMPVMEFEFNSSWGYNPAFYFAPDKYYGPADDLRRFVAACHEKGIAVILDIALNHTFGRSPLVRLYNEGDYGAPLPTNPWYNQSARHPYNVGYDVNHESRLTQEYVDRVTSFWLENYRIDGFRFDLSKGFTQKFSGGNVSLWGAYDASRIALLTRMAEAIWQVDATAYVILEHFSDLREERELAAYGREQGRPGMLLWHNMNRAYSQSTGGYLNTNDWSSNLNPVYYKNRGFESPSQISYMESHDEQWLMYRNIAYGRSADGYDIRKLPVALDRMKLAGAFFLTVPGPKMLWQFGELGYGYGSNGEECLRPGSGLGECPTRSPGRTDRKPIRWAYRDDPTRLKLYKTWSEMLWLRKEHDVFRSPDTEVEIDAGQGKVVRTLHLSNDDMQVVIAGNFGVSDAVATPGFHHAGWWYDFFGIDSLNVEHVDTEVHLRAGEFKLFTSQRVGFPESNLITVDSQKEIPEQHTFIIEQTFPNPFDTKTNIRFSLDSETVVRLSVFDILGREIDVLAHDVYAPGRHHIEWAAARFPAGLYIVRLAGEEKTAVIKTVKLR